MHSSLDYVESVVRARLTEMGFSLITLDRDAVKAKFDWALADDRARYHEIEIAGVAAVLGVLPIAGKESDPKFIADAKMADEEARALSLSGRAGASHMHRFATHSAEGAVALYAIALPGRMASDFGSRMRLFMESFTSDELLMAVADPSRPGPLHAKHAS